MRSTVKRSLAVLVAMVLGIFGCMAMAHGIQTNHGTVAVSEGTIALEKGDLTYKLYVPATATASAPAPGVLLLHGYQNDHETCAAYAIELARRGVVVMALDEYGHGGSGIGLKERGIVNHRVKTIFGQESEAEGTYTSVGGPDRFKLMMNFSNLSFFDDYYSKDDAGGAITDSSCGGIDAYAVLAEMPFVDSARLGVSGHSMGTWSSWTVAAAYAGTDIAPKATVLQCGELFRKSVYDTDSIFSTMYCCSRRSTTNSAISGITKTLWMTACCTAISGRNSLAVTTPMRPGIQPLAISKTAPPGGWNCWKPTIG